jgi:hypothetical protein
VNAILNGALKGRIKGPPKGAPNIPTCGALSAVALCTLKRVAIQLSNKTCYPYFAQRLKHLDKIIQKPLSLVRETLDTLVDVKQEVPSSQEVQFVVCETSDILVRNRHSDVKQIPSNEMPQGYAIPLIYCRHAQGLGQSRSPPARACSAHIGIKRT